MEYAVLSIIILIFCVLLISFVCYLKVFYLKRPKPLKEDEYNIPKEPYFQKFKEQLTTWIKTARSLDYEKVETISFDGLKLSGKYYEKIKGAPIEIMFHGYKGSAERDLSGGIERCFALDRNALIVDQRGAGNSQGRTTTFGIKESLDCLKWIDFAISRFGKDVKIILTGISMGGTTVLTATQYDLPKNVKYVLSDCAFSSAEEIIKKVIADMNLPVKLAFPFVKLGGIIFGKFNLSKTSPICAIQNCKVPVIFFHGNKDSLIPYEMSVKVFEKCKTTKKLILIDGAEHGLAYPVDKQKYLSSIREFENEINL